MYMTRGARAPSNQLTRALRVIIAALATSRATQTSFVNTDCWCDEKKVSTFIKFVAAFCSLLFVWLAGDMLSLSTLPRTSNNTVAA